MVPTLTSVRVLKFWILKHNFVCRSSGFEKSSQYTRVPSLLCINRANWTIGYTELIRATGRVSYHSFAILERLLIKTNELVKCG